MQGHINQDVANCIKLLADKCVEIEQRVIGEPWGEKVVFNVKRELEEFMGQFKDVAIISLKRSKPGWLRVCFVGCDEKGHYVSMVNSDEQYK